MKILFYFFVALETLICLAVLIYFFSALTSFEIVLPASENAMRIIVFGALNIIAITRYICLWGFDSTIKKIIFTIAISIPITIITVLFVEIASVKKMVILLFGGGLLLTTYCIVDYKTFKKHPDFIGAILFRKNVEN